MLGSGGRYAYVEQLVAFAKILIDSVACERTVDTAAGTLSIVPSRVLYKVDFGSGAACMYYFGET